MKFSYQEFCNVVGSYVRGTEDQPLQQNYARWFPKGFTISSKVLFCCILVKNKSERNKNLIESPFYPDIAYKPRPQQVTYAFGEYPSTKPMSRMLQMQMRFIPLANHEPKTTDAPYLFKIPSQPLKFTNPNPRNGKIPSGCIPTPKPKTPEVVCPTEKLGLAFPRNAGPLLKRAHQNFVLAYLDFYNYKVNPQSDSRLVSADSGSQKACATCCPMPRGLKELEKKLLQDATI